jgi:hypothetical protein
MVRNAVCKRIAKSRVNYANIVRDNLKKLYTRHLNDRLDPRSQFRAKAYFRALQVTPNEIYTNKDALIIGGKRIQDRVQWIIKNNKDLPELSKRTSLTREASIKEASTKDVSTQTSNEMIFDPSADLIFKFNSAL